MFSVLFPMCCCSIKSYWVVLHCKILLIVLIICACGLSSKIHYKTFYTTFVIKCDSTDKEQRFWFCRNEPVTPNTITNHSITKPLTLHSNPFYHVFSSRLHHTISISEPYIHAWLTTPRAHTLDSIIAAMPLISYNCLTASLIFARGGLNEIFATF